MTTRIEPHRGERSHEASRPPPHSGSTGWLRSARARLPVAWLGLGLGLGLGLALTLAPAAAESVKVGDLTIENAWARATPKGSQVGAGYLTIRNDGATPDRLTGAAADFATVQVHEMKSANGVMEMREVTGGVEIPAHASVKFAPGGLHLMFVGLKAPLLKGETAKATLTFEHAGQAALDMPIMSAGASGAGGSMKGMKGM